MADRVQVMLWCSTCVAGPHLPAFAAEEAGLFAERDLDVDLIPIVAAPDRTLRGLSERVRAVADGRADLAFTSIAYFLSAQSDAGGALPARFAAVCHRRSPIAALVAADSDLHRSRDLAGRLATTRTLPWFVREYEAALERLGVEASVIVDTPSVGDPLEALARGDIDVIPTIIDMLPVHARTGGPQRTIPLDIEVYGSGLVASERLPLELVQRVLDALGAGFELQRAQPQIGIAAYRHRFPQISEDHVRHSWSIFERYADAGPGLGDMDAERWQTTIDYTTAVHGLRPVAPETVYSAELLAEPTAPLADPGGQVPSPA